MIFNFSSSPRLRTSGFLAVAVTAVFSQFASASPIIDNTVGVTYELTSTFTPVSDNTYDVFLAVDATGFKNGPADLIALALQFQQNASVLLVDAPGGPADWLPKLGGTNSSGCDGNGNFECFKFDGSDNAAAVPAFLHFEFAVTLPAGTTLSSDNDVKAVYNTAQDGSGDFRGQTSLGGTIDTCILNVNCGSINPNGTTPEPGTMVMMFSGLGLLGIGAFRKVRS